MSMTDQPKRTIRRVSAENASAEAGVSAVEKQPRRFSGNMKLNILDPLMAPFVLCLFAGAILEGLERVSGFTAVALFGPVLATAAYPVWGWLSGMASRPSLRERLADNSYYLGFIFTQISLLVGFGVPALTRQQISSNDVLRFFGVAIGASMVGLIARTIIVQTGHTVSENADIVQDEVEILSKEVGTLAKGVSDVARGVLADLTSLSEQLEKSRDVIATGVSRWSGSITEGFRQYDRLLEEQAAASSRSIVQVDQATRDVTNGLSEGTRVLAERILGATTSIDGLKHALEVKLTGTAEQVLASTRSIVEATDAARSAQGRATAAVDQITENIRAAATVLGQGLAAMKALDAVQARFATLDTKLDDTVATGENLLSHAGASARNLRADLEAASTALAAALRQFREELETVRA